MSNAPITELDFNQIKENLKDYLKGQDRFKDYNFEGSNMNVLLDILAYNTFQNGFYTNMAINEMFLDTAQLRGSVVSHAKALNYVPRSRVSARAKVDVTLAVNNNPSFVTIPAKTKFVARCGNETFNFWNPEAQTITPVNGVYVFRNLTVYEGRYTNEFFTVDLATKRFPISNANVDISSVKVYVRESEDATAETEFVYATSIFGNTPTSNVFYVQAFNDETYEVVFGGDNFGVQPKNGNVIRIEYRVTSGEEANGITSITAGGNIQGYPTTVTLVATSEGGYEKEDTESIRYFAPRAFQIQDRAVTENDYEIILKNRFPEIQAISVFGGEELNPPRFGRVVIAVDVDNADGVSENNKAIYASYVRERAPIGIEPIIMSPEFMHLSVATKVYYNTKTTSQTVSAIKQTVLNAIMDYNTENLSDFKTIFRPSRLSGVIDDSDSNILSNDLEVLPIIPLSPQLGVTTRYDVTFNNALEIGHHVTENDSLAMAKPAVRTSSFTYDGSVCFILDDGEGKLNIVKAQNDSFKIVKKNTGTVDYETGRIIIRDFKVSSFVGSEIKVFARTRTPTINPPKNRILSIRAEDVTIDVVGAAI